MDQLLNAMRTNPVANTKEAHVQVYPTTNLVHSPAHSDMVRHHDLCNDSHLRIAFSSSPGTLPATSSGRIWASPHSMQPSSQRVISRTSPNPLSTRPLL